MLKRVVWTDDAVLSIRLKDDLYTLAQMRKNHIMQFFNIKRVDPNWSNVDLNSESPIFAIFVAENKLKPLFVEKMAMTAAVPSRAPIPRLMLSAVIGAGTYGAKLVELTPDYSSYGARIVKGDLSPKDDLELIHRYELAGMVGDPEKLKTRLLRFFETGVNWDDAKSFLFKGVKLPNPQPMQK